MSHHHHSDHNADVQHKAKQEEMARLRAQPSKTNVNVAKISGQVLQQQKTGDLKDANFPKDADGRTYHVGAKRGDSM